MKTVATSFLVDGSTTKCTYSNSSVIKMLKEIEEDVMRIRWKKDDLSFAGWKKQKLENERIPFTIEVDIVIGNLSLLKEHA